MEKKYNVSITKDDYLEMLMYQVFTGDVYRKRFKKNRLSLTLTFLFLAPLFYALGGIYIALFYLLAAIAWYFYYPRYYKKKNKEFFDEYVEEKLKDALNKEETVVFRDDAVLIKSDSEVFEIKRNSLEELVELPHVMVIHVRSGKRILIPKRYITDKETFISYFTSAGIKYSDFRHLKWGGFM